MNPGEVTVAARMFVLRAAAASGSVARAQAAAPGRSAARGQRRADSTNRASGATGGAGGAGRGGSGATTAAAAAAVGGGRSAQRPKSKQAGAASGAGPSPAAASRAGAGSGGEALTGEVVFERIRRKLDGASPPAPYKHMHHAAVRTSEEAARVRGTSLASGAKAMLFSGVSAPGLALVVLSATRKLNMKAVRKSIGKKAKFASEEEVLAAAGCQPGAVPPIGSVMNGVTTYMDESLREQGDVISFNAGLRTDSMVMSVADYERLEQPIVVKWAA